MMTPRLRRNKRLNITIRITQTRQSLVPRSKRMIQARKHTPPKLYSLNIGIEIRIRTWAFEEPEVDERGVTRVIGRKLYGAAVALGVDFHHREVEVVWSGPGNYVHGLGGPVALEGSGGEREHHEVALVEGGLRGFEHYCAERALDVWAQTGFPLEERQVSEGVLEYGKCEVHRTTYEWETRITWGAIGAYWTDGSEVLTSFCRYSHLRVILEVGAHAGKIYNNGNTEVLKVGLRSDTREQEKLRTIESAT